MSAPYHLTLGSCNSLSCLGAPSLLQRNDLHAVVFVASIPVPPPHSSTRRPYLAKLSLMVT